MCDAIRFQERKGELRSGKLGEKCPFVSLRCGALRPLAGFRQPIKVPLYDDFTLSPAYEPFTAYRKGLLTTEYLYSSTYS